MAGGHDVRSSVVTSQIDLHRAFGGVVPEIAGRAHLQLLPAAVEQALADAGTEVPDAVAATAGPGLLGALVVGVSAAKALALAWDVPFVAVNHLEAHLYAAFLDGAGHTGGTAQAGRSSGDSSPDTTTGAGQAGALAALSGAETAASSGAEVASSGAQVAASSGAEVASSGAQVAASSGAEVASSGAQVAASSGAEVASSGAPAAAPSVAPPGAQATPPPASPATGDGPPGPSLPMIVLLVSGGHTMLIEMTGHGRYELLGQTLDDAAGEAYDKVARLLGLGYPGGPVIDRLATEGDPEAIRFPRPMAADGLDFSFSGLKTAVAVYLRRRPEAEPANVAASFQRAVTDVLEIKTLRAARSRGVNSLCLAGGVAANSELRRRFEALGAQGMEVFIPTRAMCTDNAAMVAAAGWHQLQRQGPSPLEASPTATWTIPTT